MIRCDRTVLLGTMLACVACAEPPGYTTDDADAVMLEAVLREARSALELGDTIVVHPHLGMARDSAGQLLVSVDEFEYAPSRPLALLAARDSTIVLCTPDAHGACGVPAWLVVSPLRRIAARDAELVVLALDRTDRQQERPLLVRLRYRRGAWRVAGSMLATAGH